MLQRALILLLLLIIATPLYAAVHRWTDENGNVHYSDRAPATQKEKSEIHINVSKPDPTTVERLQRQQEALKSNLLIRDDQNKQQLADKEEAKQQLEYCKQAKERLSILQNNSRVFAVDKEGNETFMEDSQRQEQVDKANEMIKKYCK